MACFLRSRIRFILIEALQILEQYLWILNSGLKKVLHVSFEQTSSLYLEIMKEGVKMDSGPHQLHMGPDKRFPRTNRTNAERIPFATRSIHAVKWD